MWWRRFTNGDFAISWRTIWTVLGVFVLVGMMFGTHFRGNWWFGMVLLFWIIPMFTRHSRSPQEKHKRDEYEKPKTYELEKPKRYVESEDGAQLEVIEETPNDESHIDFV